VSDFDHALERLIGDPEFRAALAADPERALAGYTLSPDERELLGAQVDGGTGGERQVEQRTSKAGLFGLLTPLGGTGLSDALRGGDVVPGSAADGHVSGIARAGEPFTPGRGFQTGGGIGIGGHGTSGPGITTGGALPGTPATDGLHAAPGAPTDDLDPGAARPAHGSFAQSGDALDTAHDRVAPAERGTVADRPYHARVDADGDGRWDDVTAVDRGTRGYDLVVDADGDGRADFVGHDYDRDGLIDAATTDGDGDGRLDTTWVDTDGDGWLDRRGPLPEEPPAADGGRHRAG
jgi:hypothetical protein